MCLQIRLCRPDRKNDGGDRRNSSGSMIESETETEIAANETEEISADSETEEQMTQEETEGYADQEETETDENQSNIDMSRVTWMMCLLWDGMTLRAIQK